MGANRKLLITIIIFTIIIVFHGGMLMRYPPPFIDEGWLGARDWEFIHTGINFGTFDKGVIDKFNGYWKIPPLFPTIIQSVGMRFYSYPNLLPMRLISLTFGIALLVLVYFIVRHLVGIHQANLSIILIGISWPFTVSSHLARFDIYETALGFFAISIYVYNRLSRRWWLDLISGLCIGLAFEMHPNSVIYGLTLTVLYLWDFRWKMVKSINFWSFICGNLVGLFVYAKLHFLPYPETYKAVMLLLYSTTHTPPLLNPSLKVFINSAIDTLYSFRYYNPVALPILIWSFISIFRRLPPGEKTLHLINLSFFLGNILIMPNKIFFYSILISPISDVLLAILIINFLNRSTSKILLRYFQYALVICLFVSILFLLTKEMNVKNTYKELINRIQQVIQPGDKIMGNQAYWFGLYEHPCLSWENLVYYNRYAPGTDLEEAMAEFKPDILILDSNMELYISDKKFEWNYQEQLRIPKTELDHFLEAHAQLIDEFNDQYYAHQRIYRINW